MNPALPLWSEGRMPMTGPMPRHYSLAKGIATLIMACETMPEKILEAKFDALRKVNGMLNWYAKENFDEKILDSIMAKKAEMILQAATVKDIREITAPPKPKYNGGKWYTSPNSVPEEEMILWSITSLKAPLSQEAFERYKELFEAFYRKGIDELLKGR